MDELPEFHRNVLEALRQPLEDGYVTVSRVNRSIRFPSKLMLVCAMNPRRYCKLDNASRGLLKNAISELGFSARCYDKISKVSRTIADLEGKTEIDPDHISEAIQYRSLDRSHWI